jgi:hypothetical protein
MSHPEEHDKLRKLEESIAAESGISAAGRPMRSCRKRRRCSGSEFSINPPGDKESMSLGRVYRLDHFPAEQAGQDFARLIAETISLLRRIPDAI